MRTLEELKVIILTEPDRFYKLTEWKGNDGKRAEILRRDHYECMRCNGKWKSDIPLKRCRLKRATHVHHIKPLKDYPELCLTDDNLISLCFGCHEDVERRGFSQEKREPLTKEMW